MKNQRQLNTTSNIWDKFSQRHVDQTAKVDRDSTLIVALCEYYENKTATCSLPKGTTAVKLSLANKLFKNILAGDVFIGELSIYESELAIEVLKVFNLQYIYLSKFIKDSLVEKKAYLAQYRSEDSEYITLIKYARWPLFRADGYDAEAGKNLDDLMSGASHVAEQIKQGKYLLDSFDLKILHRNMFYALKAYELGLIELLDFTTYVNKLNILKDQIKLPDSEIKVKQLTLNEVLSKDIISGIYVPEILKKTLQCREYKHKLYFSEKDIAELKEKILKLPAHQQAFFIVQYRHGEATKGYDATLHYFGFFSLCAEPEQYFGLVFSDAVFNLIREIYFKSPLVETRYTIGEIDKATIGKDAENFKHVVTVNYAGQTALKADNTVFTYSSFGWHDKNLHLLWQNAYPDDLYKFRTWLHEQFIAEGFKYDEGKSIDPLFHLIDFEGYFILQLYSSIRRNYPEKSHKEIHNKLMEKRYQIVSRRFKSEVQQCC